MKARTVCPMAPKLRTNAPATSARPPVFAYGTISELNRHSFNAVMKRSLTNAANARACLSFRRPEKPDAGAV